MVKRIIRKIVNYMGLDIHRIVYTQNKDDQLRNYFLKNKWLIDFKISTVLDIGANEGQFAEKMRMLFPSSNIYSFEPIN